MAKRFANELHQIYLKSKDQNYIGEAISQYQHAVQAAHFARKGNASKELIVAALLHDIGHLITDDKSIVDDDLGVINHHEVGASFLLRNGISNKVADLVGHHVNAKRYLVKLHHDYAKKLSPASAETLKKQGGPMADKEFLVFRQKENLSDILKIRQWDEMAKEVDLEVLPFENYLEMIDEFITTPQ